MWKKHSFLEDSEMEVWTCWHYCYWHKDTENNVCVFPEQKCKI
jgi:hypothetical protein